MLPESYDSYFGRHTVFPVLYEGLKSLFLGNIPDFLAGQTSGIASLGNVHVV